MKALVLLLSLVALCSAQARKPADDKKRLAKVTWDLTTHQLIWEVQTGRTVNGDFEAQSTARYEIIPDEAVMKFQTERRGFTEQEAASLHKLLDTLSLYCAESVVWWDQGQGRKLKEGEPGKPPKDESPSRIKVKDGETPRRPAPAPTGPPALAARAEL